MDTGVNQTPDAVTPASAQRAFDETIGIQEEPVAARNRQLPALKHECTEHAERVAVHFKRLSLSRGTHYDQRGMPRAHDRKSSGPPVQMRITRGKVLLLADHLAHHRVDAAHGVFG